MQKPLFDTESPQSGSAQHVPYLDYFSHANFANDPDILYRSRILAFTLLSFLVISCGFGVYMLFANVPPWLRLTGLLLCFASLATYAGLLILLKHRGQYSLCTNTVVFVILIAVTLGVSLTGGITSSPLSKMLVVPPVMGFFFNSIRGGIVATIAVVVVIVALESTAASLPNTMRPEQAPFLKTVLLIFAFFLVITFIHSYERISAALRSARDRDRQKVLRLAQTDQLTGISNRPAFDKILAERIDRSRETQPNGNFTICYLDLDGFKPINDRHGHDVGDQVLRTVSIRLRSALRGTDLVGRHGGDEFMLLLDELNNVLVIETMAKRFLEQISEPIETSAGLVRVGASLGFAIFPVHASDPEALRKAADIAMYEAKRQRSGWKIFDGESVCLL